MIKRIFHLKEKKNGLSLLGTESQWVQVRNNVNGNVVIRYFWLDVRNAVLAPTSLLEWNIPLKLKGKHAACGKPPCKANWGHARRHHLTSSTASQDDGWEKKKGWKMKA